MYQLQVANTIDDFDSWRKAFDKFERVRADGGVRSYRVTRSVDDPTQVYVELDFDDLGHAQQYLPVLQKIWATPQSHSVLRGHGEPQIRETVVSRIIEVETAAS
ncbi:hypothetical protein [Gordonia rhizosphera]|uniref:ABM domain-containing protein n=1 Tax=Gordonia rhizosphera NBRC 16068 TaxID=1108045 RepID=K6X3Z8_9ACTN|nr:hypothetical protein [Gordonia rhizosphera]GAB93539.1 hypothetical protein GORHZ_227_00280 [Gordonia rhizosphera NBRC 16068]